MIVLSPEGKTEVKSRRVAALPRFADLRGKRIGLLDNSKPMPINWPVAWPNCCKSGTALGKSSCGGSSRRKRARRSIIWTSWRPPPILFSADSAIEARVRRGVSTTQSSCKDGAGSRLQSSRIRSKRWRGRSARLSMRRITRCSSCSIQSAPSKRRK